MRLIPALGLVCPSTRGIARLGSPSVASTRTSARGPWSERWSARGHAAAVRDRHVSQDADRLASARARRAAAAREHQVCRHRIAGAEVHLVRRLSSKRRMRKHVVVFARGRRTPPAGGLSRRSRASGGRAIDVSGNATRLRSSSSRLSSVNASRRRRFPCRSIHRPAVFTFSTPASANTTGECERAAARLASSSTATLLTGVNVSATCHATIRREKLSIAACRYGPCPVGG